MTICTSPQTALTFLMKKGIMARVRPCPNCQCAMRISQDKTTKDGKIWRCTKSKCGGKLSNQIDNANSWQKQEASQLLSGRACMASEVCWGESQGALWSYSGVHSWDIRPFSSDWQCPEKRRVRWRFQHCANKGEQRTSWGSGWRWFRRFIMNEMREKSILKYWLGGCPLKKSPPPPKCSFAHQWSNWTVQVGNIMR